ncbi:MAG: aspartate kinase [Planctomycetota bacterium]
MADLRVCKFGGTSVATAERLRAVQAICDAEPARRVVVPSAPGKAHCDDTKVTDLLYLAHELASKQQPFDTIWRQIEARFTGLVVDLGLDLDLGPVLDEIREAIAGGASAAYAASRGEAVNGRIVAALLGARYVDAADVIRFGAAGRVAPATFGLVREACAGTERVVIPGFYGSDRHGRVRTFTRGGSDVTGAVIAAAIDATLYENWTDVPGVLATDPRIVTSARPITEITYDELRELAYMGANVLHEEAVFPVRDKGIPINIRSTGEPEHPGTVIVADRDVGDQVVVGIAGRAGFTVFQFHKPMMNSEVGFGRRVLDVFERFGISYEHTPTGIDTMSVVVADETLGEDREEQILEDLRAAVKTDDITLLPGMALIATVGKGMNHNVGVAGRLFSALGKAAVNVRMIDQGSSEQNIIVGVDAADLPKAIQAIYEEFA